MGKEEEEEHTTGKEIRNFFHSICRELNGKEINEEKKNEIET
jgi:hypothetical protein